MGGAVSDTIRHPREGGGLIAEIQSISLGAMLRF